VAWYDCRMFEPVSKRKLPVIIVGDRGKSFHSPNDCYVLKRTPDEDKILVTKEDAVALGLTACPYCHEKNQS